MKSGLTAGKTQEVGVTVTPEMCAALHGRAIHPVYATYTMVRHMEEAARKVLEPYLEDHEDGIGTHISVDHLRPARVGTRVRIVAECAEARDDRVVCKVEAYDGSRLLGRGTHVQQVRPKEVLNALFERS